MISLSKDQKKVLDSLLDWHNSNRKSSYITLGGYAGTGKTTLLGVLRSELNKIDPKLRVAFCSYTGKATRVLRNKLDDSDSLYKKDSVSTIHSLIYSPIVSNSDQIVGWERKDEIKADLIVIDEASMVSGDIWKDLLSYQIPIIAVGDHGQLPPIQGKFNLMGNPMLKLEKIHRQVEGNPIIKVSVMARNDGYIPAGEYKTDQGFVKKFSRSDSDSQSDIGDILSFPGDELMVLCGYNNTRIKLNSFIRQALEFETNYPEINDRVVCLRNNHEKSIFNGMLGKIVSIKKESNDWYMSEICMDGQFHNYKGLISVNQFNSLKGLNFGAERVRTLAGDLFDFGYALTVHKAQGSQSRRVVLFEERFKKMDDLTWRQWLYTGVTRAEEELYILGD